MPENQTIPSKDEAEPSCRIGCADELLPGERVPMEMYGSEFLGKVRGRGSIKKLSYKG